MGELAVAKRFRNRAMASLHFDRCGGFDKRNNCSDYFLAGKCQHRAENHYFTPHLDAG